MRADLAACLPDDADNVYVVLTARDLNPRMHIVARAAEEQAEPKLIRAGANRVVAPTIIGGHRMAMALTKPAVDDFLGSITANKLELAFEQLEVESRINSGRTRNLARPTFARSWISWSSAFDAAMAKYFSIRAARR